MHRNEAPFRHVSYRIAAAVVMVVASLLALPAMASSEPVVRSVAVAGNQRTETEVVLSAAALKSGEPLTAQRIDRSIKALYATGLFSDVRIAGEPDGRVMVTVVENARVTDVTFVGNKAIETAKLAAATGLKRGAIYTRARAHADEVKLRDLYRREGRWRAAIETSVVDSEKAGASVTFIITEGDVNKVLSIGFSGIRAYTESQLRDVITTTQSGWLDLLKSNLTYDKDRLELDRALLVRHYHSHGYADAKVGEPTTEQDASGNFRIVFPIEEGDRFSFGAQTVESAVTGVAIEDLRSRVLCRPGDTYDGIRIESTVDALTERLANTGQPFARVVPAIKRDGERRTIAVTYRIEQGRKLHIRRIDIFGNTRTRDPVIRRELRVVEGDPFNAVLAAGAKKRLMGTGFFKSVDVAPVKTADSTLVDLKVAVVEQDTGDLSFGIGYSMNDGVIGDIGYSDTNFLGTGRTVKLKLEGGQRRYGAEVGFTEPHLLDSNVAAGFDLFYRDTDRTLQSSYKEQRYGGTLRLGIPLTETVSSGVSYSFTRSTLYGVGANASRAIRDAVPGFPTVDTSTYDTSSIGYFSVYDTRDKRRNPTSGVLLKTSQDVAGLGGDARYVRSTVDARAFYSVADGITLSGRVAGGTIGGYSGQDVRLLDLFYRGGETVRGFATAGIGPRDSFSSNLDALGGKTYYVTSAEMKFALPFAPAALGLSGLVFADAGSLFNASKTALAQPGLTGNSAAPRVSTGAGLVWDSPVGPLQATYGFALSKQPGDKTQPFNFGLGSGM